MNFILYMIMSLDGYIADKEGSVKWLDKYNKIDTGYSDFIKEIDCIVMGSTTYEQVIGFDCEWPYKDIKSYVLSEKHYKDKNIETSCSNIDNLLKELKIKGYKNVWVMGGAKTCQSFLNKGLINKIDLFISPDILGEGIKLFENLNNDISLPLTYSEIYKNKILRLIYKDK